jgi:predicted 3-demethylubiquinone-9 3-methyltransferase (glyoxalase superfamily)
MAGERITTCLWFDGRAEEAAAHYTSIFERSKILQKVPGPGGSVLTVEFEIDGRRFTALNGGPMYKFTEAMSLIVHCETQAEVDTYWSKLAAGGEEGPCGWLKDKFGVSWQVVPHALIQLMQDPDPAKAKRVVDAMMKMKKIVIADLQRAHRGP